MSNTPEGPFTRQVAIELWNSNAFKLEPPPGSDLSKQETERLKQLETEVGGNWEHWAAHFRDWQIHAFAEVAYCKKLTTAELRALLQEPSTPSK